MTLYLLSDCELYKVCHNHATATKVSDVYIKAYHSLFIKTCLNTKKIKDIIEYSQTLKKLIINLGKMNIVTWIDETQAQMLTYPYSASCLFRSKAYSFFRKISTIFDESCLSGYLNGNKIKLICPYYLMYKVKDELKPIFFDEIQSITISDVMTFSKISFLVNNSTYTLCKKYVPMDCVLKI